MGFNLDSNGIVKISFDSKESEAVLIAIGNLKKDLKKTLGVEVNDNDGVSGAGCGEEKQKTGGNYTAGIIVGTIGVSQVISDYEVPRAMLDDNGNLRKEAYSIKVCGDSLVILGSDRRGTIYGIYELCEMLGVSPWYYFADVPVKKRTSFELKDGYEKTDYPTVEYRGFFINDEEELEHWVQKYLGEETIGLKAYEKIFELVLRLKANYMWPAMHVNSFNMNRENGALADRMGVVIGTSHCDMLMRSNNREWKPWKAKKGYDDAMYDYSVEGRNREILKEYWQESIEQNKDFEVSYTLGMRGVHDSGFEIRGLKDKTPEELTQAKVDLLEDIINTQNKMLEDTLDYNPVKIFVPYKEVLPLYDFGLKVPEDFTLIWSNDNYGYVRRYPSEQEKLRSGGNGIYYHNSYWAPAGRSYVFLCSTPLAHTKNELSKAYAEGIRKLWVMNIGAIKPLEQEMSFFARLSWDIDKKDVDVDEFVTEWIDKTFTGGHGAEVAALLNSFSPLANIRKIETLDNGIFSQTAYGDEFAAVVNSLKCIYDKANEIYETIAAEERDAFFQMVMLRIHAVYYTYSQYYYADRSKVCCIQGKLQAAKVYTEYSKEFDDLRRKLIYYYNNIMSEGKWDRMVTPEEFPPPKTAMHPACMPPLAIGERKMLVTLWNDEDGLCFVRKAPKWFELANAGVGEFEFKVDAPEWIELSETSGVVTHEKRIIVSAKDFSEDRQGTITVINVTDGVSESFEVEVSSLVTKVEKDCVAIEDGGIVVVRAETCGGADNVCEAVRTAEAGCEVGRAGTKVNIKQERMQGWKLVKKLGRGAGSLLEAVKADDIVTYPVYFTSEGEFRLELHRFPSLNSVGRIRVAVRIDDGEWSIIESESIDEHKGTWGSNSLNNVDKLYFDMPKINSGLHNISFKSIDKYFAFSKLVIYTRERKQNNLALFAGVYGACDSASNAGCDRVDNGRKSMNYSLEELPVIPDFDSLASKLYGDIALKPRRVYYAEKPYNNDTLVLTDTIIYPESYAAEKSPADILAAADGIFAEQGGSIKIDAATVIRQTENAFTTGGEWEYCNSESYGRSGLAVFVPEGVIEEGEPAPAINYKVNCMGGKYTVWVYMRSHHIRPSVCKVDVDNVRLADEQMYNNGRRIWRYEAEFIWRWIPFAVTELGAGEHLLTIASQHAGVRFDRIYLTRNNELPPQDTAW